MRRAAACGLAGLLVCAWGARVTAAPDAKLVAEIRAAVDVGVNWMRWQLTPDGTWGSAELTARTVHAFAASHRRYVPDDGPFMRRPVAFLRQQIESGAASVPASAAILTSFAALGGEWRMLAQSAGPQFAARTADAVRQGAPLALGDLAAIADALAATATGDAALRSELTTRTATAAAPGGRPEYADALRYRTLVRLGAGDHPVALEARDRVLRAYGWWGAGDAAAPPEYWLALVTALRDTGRPAITDAKGQARDWGSELARLLLARQQFDGFWSEGNDRVAATTAAVSALEILFTLK